MPLIVPLQATPSQLISVTLNSQACQIAVKQKATGLFVDLFVDDALIIGGVLAENLNVLVRSAYLGFVGDLLFYDIAGTNNPDYLGLGVRYFLEYFTPDELPPGLQ